MPANLFVTFSPWPTPKLKSFIKADLLRKIAICRYFARGVVGKGGKCLINTQIMKEAGGSVVKKEKKKRKTEMGPGAVRQWVNELLWRGEVEPRQRVEPSEPAAVHDSQHIIQPTIEHSSNLWRGEGRLSRWIARFASLPRLSVPVPFVSLFITPALGLMRGPVFWFGESLSKESFKCKCVGVRLCVCVRVSFLFVGLTYKAANSWVRANVGQSDFPSLILGNEPLLWLGVSFK